MNTKKRAVSAYLAAHVAVGLGIALVAPAARADEVHLMTGAACTPNRADAGKINYSKTLGVFNEGTSSGTIYCPVVYTDSPDHEMERAVRLHVVDRHTSLPVSCTSNGMLEDGSVGHSAGTQNSTGSSATPQMMVWPLFQGFIYNVSCVLPAAQNGNLSRLTTFGSYW